MKKSIIISIIIALIIGGGVWWYFSNNKTRNNNLAQNNNTTNYQAEKSATNNTTNNTTNVNNQNLNTNSTENVNNQNSTTNNTTNNISNEIVIPKTETEISSFSTKIYSKDPERQNNIAITCKALNTKEIKPGETFSFCDTVGKATTEKGYQEADIYVYGEKKQGLGGGNCQVSTTLYNAVAKIPELEIVERHQHSGHVPYIQEGQDAAVAYGSYDFKFKNNTQNTIKIIMENTNDNITAKIIKIS